MHQIILLYQKSACGQASAESCTEAPVSIRYYSAFPIAIGIGYFSAMEK